VGDMLAAVAAETREAAREAAALDRGRVRGPAARHRPGRRAGARCPADPSRRQPALDVVVRRGDVDARWRRPPTSCSGTFTTQRIEHAFLEPEAALAVPEGDGLRVHSQGQGAWEDRRQIAALLDLPEHAVRVTQVPPAAHSAARRTWRVQGPAALLAILTRRPVSAAAHAARVAALPPQAPPDGDRLHRRLRRRGPPPRSARPDRRRHRRLRQRRRQGPRAGGGPRLRRVPRAQRRRRGARGVHQQSAAGAMRGFGVPQVTFAVEGLLDELAELVGVDGWEIRWRNALEAGDRFGTGQLLGPGVGLKQTLLAVRDATARRPTPASPAAPRTPASATGCRSAAGDPAPQPTAPSAAPLVDRDGPGHPHRAAPDRGRGAGRAGRADPGRRSTPSASSTPARRPRRARPCSAARPSGARPWHCARRSRAPIWDLAGREFLGEHHVDWTTPIGDRTSRSADPPCLRLGDPGRDPRRGRAGWSGSSPRRTSGRAINPQIVEGQVEGGVHMGLGLCPLGGVRRRGRPSRDRDAQVAEHHPGLRDAARGGRSSSRSRSPRARTAPRAPARRSWSRRPPRLPAPCTPTTASGDATCR
jgi:hypothetical protein